MAILKLILQTDCSVCFLQFHGGIKPHYTYALWAIYTDSLSRVLQYTLPGTLTHTEWDIYKTPLQTEQKIISPTDTIASSLSMYSASSLSLVST